MIRISRKTKYECHEAVYVHHAVYELILSYLYPRWLVLDWGGKPRQHLSICNILDLGLCNTDHHQDAQYDIRVWDNPQTTV